jgi:hypothetical protein
MPSSLKSEGTRALTVVTPPLCVTRPWITPSLKNPPVNCTLPLSTFSAPLLKKFEVTSLMPPPSVFSNTLLLAKKEPAEPVIFVLATKSYVPALVTVIAPSSVAPPV